MNSGVPARSSSSNSALSTVLDDGAGALQALEAALVVERVARADGVGRHVHFDASVEQVVDGLRDAHVRLDAADDRLLATFQSKPSARAAEKTVFSISSSVPCSIPSSGAVVAEPFRVLLADERRHLQDARACKQLRRQDSATSAKDA